MSNVKKIVAASLAAVALLALFALDRPSAGPAAPAPRAAIVPARADLAEAVFSMVLARAGEEGASLSQPPSLCQAPKVPASVGATILFTAGENFIAAPIFAPPTARVSTPPGMAKSSLRGAWAATEISSRSITATVSSRATAT